MESSIFIPITFWNNSQPTFRISAIRITPNGTNLVTSSLDGELFIWDINLQKLEITPRNLLIGHSDPVTCLECTDDYAISASEGGEICRWNISDGYCTKSIKSVFVHRRIQIFKCSKVDDDLLFMCGDYHEIFIIHSVLLQTVLVLHSKAESDWVSCFHVMSSLEIGHDVVSAVNKSGYIKLWILEELNDSASYEVQSSCLSMKNVNHIKCSATQTQILTISEKLWTIFDAKYLKTICTAKRICNEKFLGGDFFDSDVLIWTNEYRFLLFKLGVDGATIKMTFSHSTDISEVFEPAMSYLNSNNKKFLVQCDVSGKTAFWKVDPSITSEKPWFTFDLSSKFVGVQSKVFDKFLKEVTCCIVISELDLFVLGCSDGTIIVVSALETLLSYSESGLEETQYEIMTGHKDRVNCLLYPHEKYPYHNKSYLLSGGSDFSVCLWDLSKYRLIHRFCVQSGEIIKLLLPPEECKIRIRNSICSVASDHSVAILNLKELKCIVLASRQLFPIVTISWRPLDDFIIIECFDGTVYIWEMETGHLDRILHGVTAQEVIYACKQFSHEDISNFYLREDSLVGKDHFRRGLFQIEKDFYIQKKFEPIIVRGFLDSFRSENQIVAFNIEGIIGKLNGNLVKTPFRPDDYRRVQVLTRASTTATNRKIKFDEGTVTQSFVKELSVFLLKILQNWSCDINGTTLHKPLHNSVISESQNVSIFLTNPVQTPKLNAINTIALMALNNALDCSDTDSIPYKLDCETLALYWQSKSPIVRKVARNLLLSSLKLQTTCERASLLHRWFKYLPHFPMVDGTQLNKFDQEIIKMRVIALVLFGVLGSDFKFKMDDAATEEKYIQETSLALLNVMQSPHPQYAELQAIATTIIGRGYSVWEQFLKFDNLFHILFEMIHEYDKHCFDGILPNALDKYINVHETLIAIAIARTDSFISYIIKEIAQTRNLQSPKTGETMFLEKSKLGIVLILSELLEQTPYIMLQHLNDVIAIFIYCINPSHLKQEVIEKLIPILEKFKQVHQCLATQRVAVGLQDGSVIIHELKTFKTHKIAAHGEAVNAVTFSPDGKVLATYSYFENKLSFWHVFSGIFGLGHVHTKCIKTYETNKIKDINIRNHFDIGEINWIDNKSVILQLCDGTQTPFHV